MRAFDNPSTSFCAWDGLEFGVLAVSGFYVRQVTYTSSYSTTSISPLSLGVQSQRVTMRISSKAERFLLEGRTDVLVRSEPKQGLESFGEVVGVEESS